MGDADCVSLPEEMVFDGLRYVAAVEETRKRCPVCKGTGHKGESDGMPIACGNCMVALIGGEARLLRWLAVEAGLIEEKADA